MKIVVTGATGLVGAEVLRQAIANNQIEEVTAIVRKPLDVQHPQIKQIIHKNFLDYSDFSEVFRKHDAMLWCLGISQSQVSKEQYEEITYDYTVAAAKAVMKANPEMVFVFLSGMGADSTEKSKTLFARIKGKAENALKALGMKKLYIVRPGGIRPVHKNPNTAFTNKLMIPFFPIFELLMPSKVINSVQLAKSMIHIAQHGSSEQVMENVYLKELSLKL